MLVQGTSTAEEVYHVLKANNLVEEFPLFVVTYKIAYEGEHPSELIKKFSVSLASLTYIYFRFSHWKTFKRLPIVSINIIPVYI